jgi:hypothetical protein
MGHLGQRGARAHHVGGGSVNPAQQRTGKSEKPETDAVASVVAQEWLPVSVADWRLLGLRDRHYEGGVGGKTAGAPGKRLAFVTFEGTAAWISYYQRPEEVDHDFGCGYLCSLFRNEGAGLSSAMIESAIALTELRWGPHPEGWLTFIQEDKVASPNPGYCFKVAGFVPVGYTRERHYLALRRYSDRAQAVASEELDTRLVARSGEVAR